MDFMEDIDKNILNYIQTDFPIISSPYKEMAKNLSISEDELLKRLKNMMEKKLITSIGPVFSSKELNYKSTLVAMEVPQEKLSEVVEIVNSYREVTHNYSRKHRYNLWFTLIAPSEEDIEEIIGEIKYKTGIEKIFNLPYKKLFKIKVNFSF